MHACACAQAAAAHRGTLSNFEVSVCQWPPHPSVEAQWRWHVIRSPGRWATFTGSDLACVPVHGASVRRHRSDPSLTGRLRLTRTGNDAPTVT